MTHPDDDSSSADFWESCATEWMFDEVDRDNHVRHAIDGVTAALLAISKRLKTIADSQLN